MSKQQARILMALCLAVILTQIVCTAIVLHRMERTPSTAEGPTLRPPLIRRLIAPPGQPVTIRPAASEEKREIDPVITGLPKAQAGEDTLSRPDSCYDEKNDTRPFADVQPDHYAYFAVPDGPSAPTLKKPARVPKTSAP